MNWVRLILAVALLACGSHGAEINALNGVAITTASTVNGVTPIAAVNGQTVVSGVSVTPLDFIYVPSTTSGNLLTTAIWAAGKKGETAGTMSYANGSMHAGGATAPMNHTYVIDDPETFAIPRSVLGVTYDGASQSVHYDETGRTGADELFETILEVDPFPSASGSMSISGYLMTNLQGDAGGNANIDHYNVSTTSFAVPQQIIPSSAPSGAGAIYAHGSGGVGQGIGISKNTWYYWSLLYNDTDNEAWVLIQDATTGALVGTSKVASTLTGAPATATIGDYLTSYGGAIYHKEIGGRFDGLFPVDVNFVSPAATGLAIAQILPDALIVTWSGVGPVGTNTLQRYKVERQINGGGYSTLQSAQTTRYYVDESGIANGDAVDYRITSIVAGHNSATATVSATVTNANALPVTANLFAFYAGNGLLELADGDSVASWTDWSGNDFHLVQAGTSQQPSYQTNEINGLPVVRFDGSTDYLTATLTALGADRTVFAVLRKATAANNTYKAALGFNSNGAILAFTNTDVGTGLLFQSPGATIGGTPTIANVLTWNFASTSSLSIFRNGTQSPGSAIDPNDLYNVADFVVGDNVPGNLPGDYDFAEIIVYDASLSTMDQQAVEAYLKAKYNTP